MMRLFKTGRDRAADSVDPLEVEDVLDLHSQPQPGSRTPVALAEAEVLPSSSLVTPAVEIEAPEAAPAGGSDRSDGAASSVTEKPTRHRARPVPVDSADKPDFAETQVVGMEEALIGEILAQANDLNREQIQAILDYQDREACKFGEAAVALGYVKRGDVMWALSKQYQYAVQPDDQGLDDRYARLDDELAIGKHPFSAAAEMVRDIRTQLIEGVLNPDASPRRALAITSPNAGDGKSWFAANLALSFSQLGSRTLLIDADLRAGRLHKVFGLGDNVPGLSSMLAGRARPNVMRPVRELRTLYLLPCGAVPPNPLELLQGRMFGLLMRQLLAKFEFVIVDTPAAEHGADCRVIGSRCGSALIIGRRHRTRLDALNTLASKLASSRTALAGVVVNDAR